MSQIKLMGDENHLFCIAISTSVHSLYNYE